MPPKRGKLKHPIRVSSLAFAKGRWTRRDAIGWLRDHGYLQGRAVRAADFRSTKNYWSIRVIEVAPNTCDYRREHWGESGILATYCVPKERKPKVVDLAAVARRLEEAV